MNEVRFSNVRIESGQYYALYISELKGYGIGSFWADALAKIKGLPREKVTIICIAPDILSQYNYDNVVILNKNTHRENRRLSADAFAQEVSQSEYIDTMIEQILSRQSELYLYMFESNVHMTLDRKERVELIGPKSEIVSMLSNKIALYEIFSGEIPMASYHICQGIESLMREARTAFAEGSEAIFVSLERSAAGANSMIASTTEEIRERFGSEREATFLLTNYIPHIADPTTLGVVISEEEVYVAGVADQKINGTKFEGSVYPSKLSPALQERLISLTRSVGRKMASLGYRGIFGCDFIVTDEGEVYFIETNPRKQGTTMEFCCMLSKSLPSDAPNLPELEYYAVRYSRPAPSMQEPDYTRPSIYWETFNYKVGEDVTTCAYVPQYNNEREMFDHVADHRIEKEYMVIEHAGEDFSVKKGSFLGRVVSVGKSYRDIRMGIDMGKRILEFTCDTLQGHINTQGVQNAV